MCKTLCIPGQAMNDRFACQLAGAGVIGLDGLHEVGTSLDSLDIVSGETGNLSGIRGGKAAVFRDGLEVFAPWSVTSMCHRMRADGVGPGRRVPTGL